MINLNWNFTKDYIALGNKRFLYTTNNATYLQKHLEVEEVIQGMQCGELNMELIKEPINNIEWEIIQSALSCFFDWDITKQDLWDSDFDYYISEYLPYDFFEYVYKYLKDIYNDYVKDETIENIPEVIVVTNRTKDNKPAVYASHWHTDDSYRDKPATLTFIYPEITTCP